MAIKDLLEYLSYSKCDCSVDYRETLGIVNGVCPHHKDSVLMVNGVRMEVFQKEMKKRQFDTEPKKIV
jgi:hypothetical protein